MDREAQVAMLMGTRERQVAGELARPDFEALVRNPNPDPSLGFVKLDYPLFERSVWVVPRRSLFVGFRHRFSMAGLEPWRVAWWDIRPVEPPNGEGLHRALHELAQGYEYRPYRRCSLCAVWLEAPSGQWCEECRAAPAGELTARKALREQNLAVAPPETNRNLPESINDRPEWVLTRAVYERMARREWDPTAIS